VNSLIETFQRGDHALGAWLGIPSPITAELAGRTGFDYVCIDMQHGMSDYPLVLNMLQAIELGESCPIARVPWSEPGIVGRVLDAGAKGLIVPMINTREDAEAAVSYCRFPPSGARSFGFCPAAWRNADYFNRANELIFLAPMIETAEAVKNIDDILSVPGVDVAYVGPSDLSVSLGLPPAPHNEVPAFNEAIAAIVAACKRHGVTPAVQTNVEFVQRRFEEGFRMLTVFVDVPGYIAAASNTLATARERTSA